MSKTYVRPARLRIHAPSRTSLLTHLERKRAAQEVQPVAQEQDQDVSVSQSGTTPPENEVGRTQEMQEQGQEWRTQQVKELLRLGNLMRADLGLDEVLRQVAASIASCTGFGIAVINLLEEHDGNMLLMPVAFAGLADEDARILQENPMTKAQMYRLMRPQYRISQSYYVPDAQSQQEFSDIVSVVPAIDVNKSSREEGQWCAEDGFFVPLVSPREQQIFGLLSLDAPENGRVPTLEEVEIIELFANQAAIAIDNARIFQQREQERLALEAGILTLREDIERIRRGDLHVHVRLTHPQLEPVCEAINVTISGVRSILSDMWMVTQAVNEHTRSVQHNSSTLVRDTDQQEMMIQRLSQVFQTIVGIMQQASADMGRVFTMVGDAREVTQASQETVDRTVDGMGKVRDLTMRTGQSMKRLSETAQEMNDAMLRVTDMSARLHLIALNAAIEAARAGEQGQGFAVVAQELRSISMTCSEASRKIGDYIRTIQQETTFASEHVEQNIKQVVVQSELVSQTSLSLDATRTITEQVLHLVENANKTTDQQAQGTYHVSNAVNEMLKTSGGMKGLMQETNSSMSQLVELSNALRSRISRLHIGIGDNESPT